MSDHQGIQDQDPAERLAAALRRIAVGIERREAVAAATRAALDATSHAAGTVPAPGPDGFIAPAASAHIDQLIARLRAVLEELPPGPGGAGRTDNQD